MRPLLITIMISVVTTFNADAQLKVMTYNIRYANENDGENSWSFRKDELTNQLQYHEPDIFGVQEALLSQLEYLEEHLLQYECLGVGRDGGEKGEFSAIFYDSSKFEVLRKDTFWLSETPAEISKGWDAALNRICTYALFRNKENGQKFWVFNTHLDHVGVEARKQSVRLIHQKISELNKEDLPVILMGDLNLEPETEEMQFLLSNYEDTKETAEHVFGPEGTFNNFEFDKPVTRRIDYIFTSGDINVEKYAVLSDSKDLRYPSDHLPVMVHLELEETASDDN